MAIARYLLCLFTVSWSLLFSVNCTAQIRFTAIADQQQIARDGVVKVDFVIENAFSIENFQTPSFNSFRILAGPDQSSGMTLINGAVSKYSSLSFVLQPIAPGKMIIPPATALVNGKQMRSNTLIIAVGNYRSGNSQPAPVSPFTLQPEVEEQIELKPGEDANEKIKTNLLVKLETDKKTCYEGEPVIAIYKLCSRLRSESRVTKRPSLNGFSVYDMVEPELSRPTIEKINGKSYNVHVIRKAQLYPLQTGDFELEPVELENKVRFLKRGNPVAGDKGPAQRLLDDFIIDNQAGTWEEHSVTLSSTPIMITVKPLPADKPDAFNGAVGNFNMEAALVQKEIFAEEGAVLQVTISGEGNLPLVNAPSVNFPKGIELYGDASIKENIDKTVAPIHGSKMFEYSFTPTDTGSFLITPIVLSYFDPAKAVYKTIETKAIPIHVLPAKKEKKANKITRAIQKVSAETSGKEWLWLIPIVLLGFTGIFFAVKKKKKKAELAIAKAAAPTVAAKQLSLPFDTNPLQNAKNALAEGDNKKFYFALQQSLWKEITTRLQLTGTVFNKQSAIAALRQKGVDREVINDFEAVLYECEMALYTPVYTDVDREKTLAKAERILAAVT